MPPPAATAGFSMSIDIASPALRLHLTETDTLEEEVNLVLKKESRYLAWPASMTLKKVVDLSLIHI